MFFDVDVSLPQYKTAYKHSKKTEKYFFMSNLEELWRGEITPNERAIKPESKYHKLIHAAAVDEKCLIENMSTEERKVYDGLCRKRSELAGMSETDAFVIGFRLGARIIMEAIGKYESQLPKVGKIG